MSKCISVLLVLLFSMTLEASLATQCQLPGVLKTDLSQNLTWVFFDIGNTLIDTTKGAGRFEYTPGALAYLKKLKKSGYHLCLISNIPVSWGESFDERLAELKVNIQTNLVKGLPDFDWNLFERIYLPAHESEYKPKAYLFNEAMNYAKLNGADSVYFQGENFLEVQKALEIGMRAHQIIATESETNFLECR